MSAKTRSKGELPFLHVTHCLDLIKNATQNIIKIRWFKQYLFHNSIHLHTRGHNMK